MIQTTLNIVMLSSLGAGGRAGGPTPPNFWFTEGASTVAPSVDQLFMYINYVCYFFFALIMLLMFYFMWKYRQRGREVNPGGPTHHTLLELTWSGLPLILVIIMFDWGFKGYMDLTTPPLNSYEIEVTAKQWSWDFKYPNGVVTSNTELDGLVVPEGRPVKLLLRSSDVLHSFYVRDFRVKKDAVPGRTNYLWFEAPWATGSFPIKEEDKFHWFFCTEYCGQDHSNMNGRVHVLEQADFDAWLAEKEKFLEKIPDEELYFQAGPQFYARCSQCHSLDGTAGIGPSWGPVEGYTGKTIWERTANLETKFADGSTLKDFVGPGKEFESAEDYILNSIVDPGKHLVQGFGNAMPTFRGAIPGRGQQAILGMMKKLHEFDPKTGKHPKTGQKSTQPPAP